MARGPVRAGGFQVFRVQSIFGRMRELTVRSLNGTLSSEDRASLTELMKPLWADWVEKADAKGWPGQKILDEAVRLSDLYDRN